jgi:hypothetical protein
MKIIFLIIACCPLLAAAQYNPNPNSNGADQKKEKKEKHSLGLGIKGGLNFADVRNAKSVSTSNQAGFMGGVFFSPQSKGILSYRTEIIYSKQGFNYATGTNTGNVNLDYIIMPHLMCIHITKFFQLQFGGQVAYLINAKQDSVKATAPSPYGTNSIMDMYNRFDYGFGGGIEIHPVAGLIIGARLNVSMGNLYKDPSSYMTGGGGGMQSPIPKIEVKNNVLQLSAGWIF